MSIAQSISIVGHAQRDGACRVLEEHTDHLGFVHRIEFGPVRLENVNLTTVRANRAAAIETLLADAEFFDRLTRVAALSLQHQTGGAFADRFRALYKAADKERLYALSWWVIEMISAGLLTDANVRNAFNMTAGEWNTFKTNKVQPRHDAWASLVSAQGE